MATKTTQGKELVANGLSDEQFEDYGTNVNLQSMLDNGTLVNVTAWASREMGYREGRMRVTVTLTSRLWRMLHAIPQELTFFQTVRGRGHDILWLAAWALRKARRYGLDCAILLVPLPTGEDEDDAKTLRIEYGIGFEGRPHVVIGLAEEFPLA